MTGMQLKLEISREDAIGLMKALPRCNITKMYDRDETINPKIGVNCEVLYCKVRRINSDAFGAGTLGGRKA